MCDSDLAGQAAASPDKDQDAVDHGRHSPMSDPDSASQAAASPNKGQDAVDIGRHSPVPGPDFAGQAAASPEKGQDGDIVRRGTGGLAAAGKAGCGEVRLDREKK